MISRAFATLFSGSQIDREAGVIRGVSVITEGIANGEIVDATSLRQIEACCKTYANGLKVVDRHTKGTDSIFATVGSLRNFRIEGTKLVADLFTLKSEPNTPKLFEMAETIPDTFGLSVAFSGPEEIVNGKPHSRCTEIYNAALVDVPAANPTGLFSDRSSETSAVYFVDARKKVTLMGAENTNPGSTEATTKPAEDLASRIKKLEDAVVAMEKKAFPAAADASCMSDLMIQVRELSEKVAKTETTAKELSAKVEDRTELAKSIAKEFASNTGRSPVVATDGAGTAGDIRQTNNTAANANPVDRFLSLIPAKFTELKSKVAAVKAAMAADPEGYKAFAQSGRQIKYT